MGARLRLGTVSPRVRVEQAMTHHREGRWREAQALYRQILADNPEDGVVWHLLGLLLQSQGENAEALGPLERAVALSPATLPFHLTLAQVLIDLSRVAEAQTHLNVVLSKNPGDADALYTLGVAFTRLGRREQALRAYRMAAAARPEHVLAHNNIGSVLHELGDDAGAALALDRALALDPDHVDALYNRGVVAHASDDDPARAIALYGRALARAPDYRRARCNRGVALMEAGRLAAALRDFDTVLATWPEEPEAMWNKSLALLTAGDLAAGWPFYDWRWRRPGAPKPLYRPEGMPWRGAADLAGKTLFVFAEQGLGDTIQFCRYGRLARAAGARVVMAVQPALMTLLRGCGIADQVIGVGTPPPPFDHWCALLDLPAAFATTLADIPTWPAYLSAESGRVAAWRQRLGPAEGRKRVGLVWRGSTTHANDRRRSLGLERLLAVLPDGCDYVALQKDISAAEQALLEGRGIIVADPALTSFAETAALCQTLDLVVSVDTSVAHLAGALGRPCWVLLPFSPDWRWLLGRIDTPWYPSLDLYRQERPGGWTEVLTRLGADLRGWVGGAAG